MEVDIDGFHFTSNFDSGNMARVEMVPNEDKTGAKSEREEYITTPQRVDFRFHVWTRPDAANTPYENSNRTWFHFAVRTRQHAGCRVQFVMQNLNKQTRLYSQGMAPVYCTRPGTKEYERIPIPPTYWSDEEQFFLSFVHLMPVNPRAITYFAFTYPYSYQELQVFLHELDERFRNRSARSHDKSDIYYYRELLCHSLEGRRIDLLTVTSRHGMTDQREPPLPCLFPLHLQRPHRFYGKRIIVLSARVHPGETPSSYVMNGFINFVLRDDDWRAARIRKMFVVKIIPMLNPDGVAMGHYRTDSRGVNLNRVYLDPVLELHPSVFAVKSLVLYHHVTSRRRAPTKISHIGLSTRISPPSAVLPPSPRLPTPPDTPVPASASPRGAIPKSCVEVPKKASSPNQKGKRSPAKGKNPKPSGIPTNSPVGGHGSLPALNTHTQTVGASESNPVLLTSPAKAMSAEKPAREENDDSDTSSSTTNSAGSAHDLESAQKVVPEDEVVSCIVPNDKDFKTLLKEAERKLPNITAAKHREAVAALLATLQECESGGGVSSNVASLSARMFCPDSPKEGGAPRPGFVTMSQEWLTFVEHVSQLRGELKETLQVMRQALSKSSGGATGRVAVADSSPGEVDQGVVVESDEINKAVKIASDHMLAAHKTSTGEQAQFWGMQGNVLGRYLSNRVGVEKEQHEVPGTRLIIPAFALQIRSEDSGIALYMDMHGHASKRGCFIYGNYFEDVENKVECMLLPKILSVNCNYFDFTSCNFTRKNMCSLDKKDGTTREGAGRVGVYKMTGIIRSYTLECNYNTGNMSSTSLRSQDATFTPAVYEEVGQRLALSILDLENVPNTGTPLTESEFQSVAGIRDWLRYYIRAPKTCLFPVPMYTRAARFSPSHSTNRRLLRPLTNHKTQRQQVKGRKQGGRTRGRPPRISTHDLLYSVRLSAMAAAMANAPWLPPQLSSRTASASVPTAPPVAAAGDATGLRKVRLNRVVFRNKSSTVKVVPIVSSVASHSQSKTSGTTTTTPTPTPPLMCRRSYQRLPTWSCRPERGSGHRHKLIGKRDMSSRSPTNQTSVPRPALRCCQCARILWRRTNSDGAAGGGAKKKGSGRGNNVPAGTRSKSRSSVSAMSYARRHSGAWNPSWWAVVRPAHSGKTRGRTGLAQSQSSRSTKPYHQLLQEVQKEHREAIALRTLSKGAQRHQSNGKANATMEGDTLTTAP